MIAACIIAGVTIILLAVISVVNAAELSSVREDHKLNVDRHWKLSKRVEDAEYRLTQWGTRFLQHEASLRRACYKKKPVKRRHARAAKRGAK